MSEAWRKNIQHNRTLVQNNSGPGLAIVVSGTELDRQYWEQHFNRIRSDVFRSDGKTFLMSVCEPVRKGNFLGTLNAWALTKAAVEQSGLALPNVSLMSMVFGQGKRLSPFTQSLGNRKAALPTPLKGAASGEYLRTADLSNLYTNLWIKHLGARGFRGMVVKWGDEAVVPGISWQARRGDYRQLDALRFVWRTTPTTELAREKDWVLIDGANQMRHQYARQPLESLHRRLASYGQAAHSVGVNLGSLAISYRFLDLALQVFRADVADPQKWVDWDPYVWMALFCETEADWQTEAEYEAAIGRRGLHELLARYPDFYAKIVQLRAALQSITLRPLTVGVMDFGTPLWTDFGLHLALRASLLEIVNDSEKAAVLRELFALPHGRDGRGNILVNSAIPASADIRHSVICDTVISDERTVIHDGVLIGGRFRRVHMPAGGAAIFSAADELEFSGPNAIALRSVAPRIHLPAGGRHTTLFLPETVEQMVTNESVIEYDGDNYLRPILGNPRSFDAAAQAMAQMDGQELERRWLQAWREWPS